MLNCKLQTTTLTYSYPPPPWQSWSMNIFYTCDNKTFYSLENYNFWALSLRARLSISVGHAWVQRWAAARAAVVSCQLTLSLEEFFWLLFVSYRKIEREVCRVAVDVLLICCGIDESKDLNQRGFDPLLYSWPGDTGQRRQIWKEFIPVDIWTQCWR